MNTPITLICTPLRFYTQHDEKALFEWLKKIDCIQDIQGIGRELHIFIKSKIISYDNIRDLMGVFDRYKFNENQLRVFITEKISTYLIKSCMGTFLHEN